MRRAIVFLSQRWLSAALIAAAVVAACFFGGMRAVYAQAPGQPAAAPGQPGQPGQPAAVPGQPVRVQRVDPHAGHNHAGHNHAGDDHAGHAHGPAGTAARAQVAAGTAMAGAALNAGTGTALVFWLFALGLVGGAVFVVTRRNLITAVMGMVGTFFAIAAIYAMLYAHFITAIQVLVYAGAIMVLFVFVIMILNKPEAEPWSTTNVAGKVVAIGVLAYLLFRLVAVLWSVTPPARAMAAPPDLALSASGRLVDYGSTMALGEVLFRGYLFPFEAVSIVLLIAVVGAVAVARPHERRPHAIPEGVEQKPATTEAAK